MSLDAIVIGGAPAGLATAIALRRQGLSVAVLEREATPRFRIGETVPADMRPALESLGAWPAFRRQEHLPSAGNASAWSTAELIHSDALRSPLGAGWHLDRPRFEAMLTEEAIRAGAEVLRGVRAAGVRWTSGESWLVAGESAGAELPSMRARLLVDGTGRRATVARWLGARRCIHDRLVCTYAVFDDTDRPAAIGRTLVESAPEGWWYATPLPRRRALAALFGDAQAPPRDRRVRAPAWHDSLRATAHVFDFLGRPSCPPRVDLAAVTPHCLDRPAGRDWIAVGDAATSFDPLASAGITLALSDGVHAAAALAQRRAGDPRALIRRGRTANHRFTRHLQERTLYYRLDARWPASSFWHNRNQGTQLYGLIAGATAAGTADHLRNRDGLEGL